MLKEFRNFIMKGNVLDLAVAVIMGGAFGAIVTALVNEMIMPLVGRVLSGVNFSEMIINMSDKKDIVTRTGAIAVGASYIGYGFFLQAIINFVIIAFVLFLVLKAYNTTKKQEAAAPVEPPADVALLTEIRDLLKKQAR